MPDFFSSPYFTYLVMPILIFCARIADVTLGTMRIVFVARGNKLMAPLLGFFEVFIWIVAIGQVMEHANNLVCYISYAAGFATGNYFGLLVEGKLAIGLQVIRIITPDHGSAVLTQLNQHGYGATRVNAEGSTGQVQIIYCVVQRRELPTIIDIVRGINPDLFYSVEDIRTASSGIFKASTAKRQSALRHWRRGK